MPGYPVTHLQKGPNTLPSAIPALCLQSELAARDGPATALSLPLPSHLSEVTHLLSLTPRSPAGLQQLWPGERSLLAEQGSVIKYSRLVLPIADMCFLPAWEADGQRVGNPLSSENVAPGVQKSAFSQLLPMLCPSSQTHGHHGTE